jgi:hypothetical protein
LNNNPLFGKWLTKEEHIGKFSSEYNRLWREFKVESEGKKHSLDYLLKKADEFEKKAMETAKNYKKTKKP